MQKMSYSKKSTTEVTLKQVQPNTSDFVSRTSLEFLLHVGVKIFLPWPTCCCQIVLLIYIVYPSEKVWTKKTEKTYSALGCVIDNKSDRFMSLLWLPDDCLMTAWKLPATTSVPDSCLNRYYILRQLKVFGVGGAGPPKYSTPWLLWTPINLYSSN